MVLDPRLLKQGSYGTFMKIYYFDKPECTLPQFVAEIPFYDKETRL